MVACGTRCNGLVIIANEDAIILPCLLQIKVVGITYDEANRKKIPSETRRQVQLSSRCSDPSLVKV